MSARALRRGARATLIISVAVDTVFAGIGFSQDVPALVTGELPAADSFERRYAENPVLAYAHIIPGLVYLGIAPFQVSRRFRRLRRLRRGHLRSRWQPGSSRVFGDIFAPASWMALVLHRRRKAWIACYPTAP